MPRRGSAGGRAPARSAPARPSVPAKQPTGVRGGSSAASPARPGSQQQQNQQQGKSPGLFGQMASTAAGVAVGSSIGHAIGGFFGGGGQAEEQQQASDNAAATQQGYNDGQYQNSGNSWGSRSCDADAKSFTKCLDENQGNMQICGWYLDQLKACQQAAKDY